jgi:hypothetical protein
MDYYYYIEEVPEFKVLHNKSTTILLLEYTIIELIGSNQGQNLIEFLTVTEMIIN